MKKLEPSVLFAVLAQLFMFLWIFRINRFSLPALDFGGNTIGISYLEHYSSVLYFSYHDEFQERVKVDGLELFKRWLDLIAALIFFIMPLLIIAFNMKIKKCLNILVAVIIILVYLLYNNFQFFVAFIDYYPNNFSGYSVAAFFALHHLTILISIVYLLIININSRKICT